MIRRQDILDRAEEWRLRPEVVEKDYVLGWLLAALGADGETGVRWVFKGGTCIKKCYIETYRFSEDLDFSLTPDAMYDEADLRAVLTGAIQQADNLSGVRFGADALELRHRQNRAGTRTYEVRLGYQGPMGGPATPKVRFDLTQTEAILLPPERRPIFHPYPDELPAGATVHCYPLEELLAEKTRALLERTRPRDLYDVVLLLESGELRPDLERTREVLGRKCAAKGILPPGAAALVAQVKESAELAAEWENMLSHQLPSLPPLAGILERLPALLGWLGPRVVKEPVAAPLRPASTAAGEISAIRGRQAAQFWGVGQPLDLVRFAGANRLRIAFDYHGKQRDVEPYAIRRAGTGNLLLYGWELAAGHIKAFKVPEIRNLRVSDRTFTPRYRVELNG